MSKYAREYINSRIDAVKALHISAEHKLHKLEEMGKYILAFRSGKITEEELLYLIG